MSEASVNPKLFQTKVFCHDSFCRMKAKLAGFFIKLVTDKLGASYICAFRKMAAWHTTVKSC